MQNKIVNLQTHAFVKVINYLKSNIHIVEIKDLADLVDLHQEFNFDLIDPEIVDNSYCLNNKVPETVDEISYIIFDDEYKEYFSYNYNEINDKIIDNMIPTEKEDMLNRLLKYIQLLYKYDYMGCELIVFGCNDGNYLNVAGINPLQTELVVLEIKGVD